MDAQSFDILTYSLQAQLTYNWGKKLHDVLNMLAVLCWAAFIATLMWPMQPIGHRLATPASLDGVNSIQKLCLTLGGMDIIQHHSQFWIVYKAPITVPDSRSLVLSLWV